MFLNYLKIAWRNLTKNKAHSFINLFGLALGLACTMVILMWIQRELSVDQFHADLDRIYQVRENQSYSGRGIFTVSATPGPLTPALKVDFPEIEYASRVNWGSARLFQRGEQAFREKGRFVDPDFLRIFTFDMQQGDPETALDRPRTVLISREMADKYFDNQNPLGEALWVDDSVNYEITGVFDNLPDHSTLAFDWLMPYEDHLENNSWLQSWNSNGIQSFIKLKAEVDPAALEAKISGYLSENSEQDNTKLFMQGFGDVYLRNDYKDGKYQGGGRITYVRMFAVIAAFILLIACINFMNLTTAQSTKRAKEVGIRRVSGATRQRLIGQFLGESLLMTFLAGILALGIVWLILPWFNQLFGVELGIDLLDYRYWLALLGLLFLTGMLAGSYPAFFLSGFEPARVMKGVTKLGGNGALWFRKGMVITQFAIATFLILSTLVIYRQMDFIKNQSLGYRKENLLYLRTMGQMSEKYETIKADLERQPEVVSVSATSGTIYSWGSNTSNFSWQGKSPDESVLFQYLQVDYDFLETVGAELAAGRDFSPEHPADSMNFVINEKAAEMMGMDDPVGQPLTHGDFQGTIIGVAKNFKVTSFYNEQNPVIMVLQPHRNYIYVRIRPGDFTTTLAGIEEVVERHNPAYPLEFAFVDDEYNQMYQSEQRVSALSRVFAFLAIFVSCLGLFGLAAFTTEQRTKEIGIRKVLGASMVQISNLLSKEFMLLVFAGFLLATPVAWYLSRQWLLDFAYHVSFDWWMVAVAGFLALAIAFGTVSLHTVRAASREPVKALRYE